MSHVFDCVIDTSEMAREVGSVKHHVDATTTAVVGMQTAVIKAHQEGADRVCRNVNQGFYAMIHSQISQKMATLQSKVDAQLMRLNQQRKQLHAIRQRMQHDYQMITARYTKLFTGLNRNLRQRVTELDRPVINFATTETDKIVNRGNQLVSVVPISQGETVKVSQRVTASNLKRRAAEAIQAIERFTQSSHTLQEITDKILLRRSLDEPTEQMTVPVCIMESNFDASGNMQSQIFVSQMGLNSEADSQIESRISSSLREGNLNWTQNEVNPEVVNYFLRMVAESGLTPNRKQHILQMFESSRIETL